LITWVILATFTGVGGGQEEEGEEEEGQDMDFHHVIYVRYILRYLGLKNRKIDKFSFWVIISLIDEGRLDLRLCWGLYLFWIS
jgi:hypothetical protein